MMDDLDKRLLAALSADSSTPVAALSRKLDIARSTVQARIERLEQRGIIAGYTIRRGETADERRIRATTLLQLEPRAAANVLQRLRPMPEVELCVSTTGRVDLILQVAADSTSDLDEILDRIGAIPGVRATESLIHLSSKFDRRS